MTDGPVEKRDPTPIVVVREEGAYTSESTHRLDMTDNVLKSVIQPVKFVQIGQTVRSLLGVAVIGGAIVAAAIGKLPDGVAQTAIWAGALIGVTNGQALTKLFEKLSEKLASKLGGPKPGE